MTSIMRVLLRALFVVVVFWSFSFSAFGQARLAFSYSPVSLSDTSVSAGVSNQGDMDSDPFRLKVWVSFDAEFSSEDPNSISPDTLSGLQAFRPGLVDIERQRVEFKLPIPPPDTRDFPRLPGDNLSPIEWIGRDLFTRVCVMDAAGIIEVQCEEGQIIVEPPIYMEGIGSLLASANNADDSEFIDLLWPIPRTDNGSLLVDRYLLRETDFDNNFTDLEFSILDLKVVTDAEGQDFYRARLPDREPGKRYHYSSVDRVCLGALCSRTLGFFNERGGVIGTVVDEISASTNLNGRVEIRWKSFSDRIASFYYVTRCEVGLSEASCIEVATLTPNTEFSDLNAMRGTQYIYMVEACDWALANIDGIVECIRPRVRIAVSSPGETGLVDEFEDDDNPRQATAVKRTASQLHSFDTPTDEDWIKIVIASSQSIEIRTSGETSEDTKITLYSSSALGDPSNLSDYEIAVATNTPGVQFASFATLITDELEPGEYFAKIEQESIPGLPPLNVFNYTLDIEFQDSTVVAPIINLLLDDD